MPELPEVEWVRRGLVSARLRAPVVRVWRSRKPLRTGAHWRNERLRTLLAAVPSEVERRGKHLLWHFDRAGEGWGLLIHLGMTGRLEVVTAADRRPAHTHVELWLADGRAVRYVDPRRFGGVRAESIELLRSVPPLSRLGVEPLEPGFDGDALTRGVRGTSRALWDLLLDQSTVAGLGNIYVLEALHRAGLHPLRRAPTLRSEDWTRLAVAIREVLRSSLDHGGTTLRDYRRVDGTSGDNQSRLEVYGRAGLRCRCGATLKPVTHAGRNGAYCPREQRAPRALPRPK